MTRRLPTVIALLGVLLFAAPAVAEPGDAAPAAEMAPTGVGTSPAPVGDASGWSWEEPARSADELDPGQAVSALVKAVQEGTWLPAIAALLVLLVWAVRRWGKEVVPWLGTDRGGVLIVLVTSFMAALVSGLADDVRPGWADIEAALVLAVTAIGGYQGLRRLLWPRDRAD